MDGRGRGRKERRPQEAGTAGPTVAQVAAMRAAAADPRPTLTTRDALRVLWFTLLFTLLPTLILGVAMNHFLAPLAWASLICGAVLAVAILPGVAALGLGAMRLFPGVLSRGSAARWLHAGIGAICGLIQLAVVRLLAADFGRAAWLGYGWTLGGAIMAVVLGMVGVLMIWAAPTGEPRKKRNPSVVRDLLSFVENVGIDVGFPLLLAWSPLFALLTVPVMTAGVLVKEEDSRRRRLALRVGRTVAGVAALITALVLFSPLPW